MVGSRSHSELLCFGKSSQNSSKPVQLFWSSIPCVFLSVLYTLLKVVGYYDLSAHVSDGFPKKSFDGGWQSQIQDFPKGAAPFV